MSPAIAFRGVRKSYGPVQAVKQLDLEIAPGRFVGLIGHNGAGKSTAIKMLTGLVRPTQGRVELAGIDVHRDPQRARQHLGAVPEEPALYTYLTAREHLEFVARVRGVLDPAQLEQALTMSGLGPDADRLIREYSQGMRRKTALAAALLGQPPVLVLDEALNGLDPPSAARVKAALRQRVDAGATVLLSTHVLETVERVADRVIMLAHGRVVADEHTADIGRRGLEDLFLRTLEATRDAGPS